MIFGKRKKKEIDHLRKLRAEAIDDAAYWYMQGNYGEYLRANYKAIELTGEMIARRHKIF